jgi:hypothetical protein
VSRLTLAALVVIATALPPSVAMADDEPDRGIRYRMLTALRGNPLGFRTQGQIEYWSQLYESDAKVLETNFVSVGIAPSISAVYAAGGPVVELQPLSVLKLSAKYDLVGYFGTFDRFQSYPDALAEHYDEEIERLGAAGRHYPTLGTRLTLGGLVQMKVGPIALRSSFQAIRSEYDVRDGDLVFYDSTLDLLAPNGGWAYTNDADLLWVSDFGLVLGVRDSYAYTEFTSAQLGGRADPNVPNHRLGALMAYSFYDDPDPVAFDRPTVVTIVSWYVQHRYRAGAQSSQAIPYVVLAFAFTGSQ